MTDSAPDDILAFDPVPSTSTRRDGWTPERQRLFIEALAVHGGVGQAARAVGMTPQSANRLRHRPGAESFTRAWDAALNEGTARSYDLAMERALHGEQVPVFHRGKQVGYRQKFNDRLIYAACYRRPPPAL
jgi:hypothetical protein